MRILHPETIDEAIRLKREECGVYLAGGTALLSMTERASEDAVLVDISSLVEHTIEEKDGAFVIGAATVFSDIAKSEILPDMLRASALLCASLPLRNQATIGGNVALSRYDSYLIPALYALGALVMYKDEKGEHESEIDKFVLSENDNALILSFAIPKGVDGTVKRFGRTSHSHSVIIAAVSGNRYGFGISGSGFAFGERDAWKDIEIRDDLTGSAAYKRYLASVIFKEAE